MGSFFFPETYSCPTCGYSRKVLSSNNNFASSIKEAEQVEKDYDRLKKKSHLRLVCGGKDKTDE